MQHCVVRHNSLSTFLGVVYLHLIVGLLLA